jgi:hypothetical protein
MLDQQFQRSRFMDEFHEPVRGGVMPLHETSWSFCPTRPPMVHLSSLAEWHSLPRGQGEPELEPLNYRLHLQVEILTSHKQRPRMAERYYDQ